ncbi:MAG: hypothetical protein Ta2A_19190 [Treponemataceae bacterium]|nr:MAG: hypothetical protein Ta2A_19190 [Treponemataceae bacterium]
MAHNTHLTLHEGEHIAARIERGRFLSRISIRNKDNICSATVARNQTEWGAGKIWDLFMAAAPRDISFPDAVNFFESHGIRMTVTG